MENTLPLLERGVTRGMAELRNEGCYMVFSIDVPQWGSGMKKVWLTSESGGRMLLGTLQPELHRLRLTRRVSHSALRCCGLREPTAAVVNPEEGETVTPQKMTCPTLPEGWHSLDTLTLENEETLQLLRRSTGGMWQRRGDTIVVRYPWRVGEPVPAMPLFRQGRPVDGWWEVKIRNSEFGIRN